MLAHWNVNGWTPTNCTLRKVLLEYLNPDFISLCETHLSNDSLQFDGYTWFGLSRTAHIRAVKASGGVGILVKNHILEWYHVTIVDKAYDGILCLRAEHRESRYSFIIISCYLSPESSTWGRNADLCFSHLLALMYTVKGDAVYICGDFNSRIGDFKDYVEGDDIITRTALDTVVNKHGHSLVEFLRDSKCCVLNGRLNPENDNFTSISIRGKAVVDYIMTPHGDMNKCLEFSVYTPSDMVNLVGPECNNLIDDHSKLPDHSVLLLRFQASEILNTHVAGCAQRVKRRNRDYPAEFLSSDACRRSLVELTEQLQTGQKSQSEIDQFYNDFCGFLHKEMDKYCPAKEIGGPQKYYRVKQPFWNDELNGLWIGMRSAERSFLKCKSGDSERQTLLNEFRERRANFDRRLRFFKRRFKRGQALQLEQLYTGNPQQFWKEINSLGPRKTIAIPMEVLLESGESAFQPEQIVEKWESDYRNLYACSSSTLFDDQFFDETCKIKINLENSLMNRDLNHDSVLNNDITIEEVQEVLHKLKLNKAVGIEDIPNEVLKSPYLDNVLFNLCYTCFQNSIVPTIWSESIIKPIPKSPKNDPRIPLNYRGISLLSTVYKIYSGILNNRLNRFMELNEILVDEQNGFRKNRACIDHLFVLSSIVRARIEKNKSTFVCFVDFKKAFDCVNRELMEFKLLSSGIGGKLYNGIKSLYSSPVACIQLNNLRTGWFPTPFGVKQGDLLSPSLFALYINDLAQEIKRANFGIPIDDINLSILLYADDIVLMAENEFNLQKMLDIMGSWCRKWRISINNEKTQIVHFRKKGKPKSPYLFSFDYVHLKYTSSYKYLGFVFDESLKFLEGTNLLAESAGRALGSLLSKLKVCPDLGFSIFSRLYSSLVESVLFYAAGIWGFKEAPVCKAIQNRALRCFLGVHKFTAKAAIDGDTGWEPCIIKQRGEVIRLWNRLIGLPRERLTSKVFNWDKANNHPWSREVAVILSDSDSYLFRNDLFCDLISIKQKMLTTQKDIWKEEILKKPKLRNYVLFKSDYSTEPYVSLKLKRRQRSLCAQLRSGTLALAIEVGRFKGIPEEQRICEFCELNAIEDEFHFLFYCPLYEVLRMNLFESMQKKNPDLFWKGDGDILSWLFENEIFVLSNYIEKAWHLRQCKLYPGK